MTVAELHARTDTDDGRRWELIAVEVPSPSTRRLDIAHERRLYERSGVAEYWFVDREAEVVDVDVFGAEDDLRTASGGETIPSDLIELDTALADLLAW